MIYYISYIIYNLLNIFIIYKSIKIILNKEVVFNKKIEIISYLIFFVISTLEFLFIRIPIIMLISNIITIFLIQFNYKTTIKNKILLTLYLVIILSIVDIIVSFLGNKSIISINIKSNYSSIIGWIFQLIICSALLKTIKIFNKMSINISIPNTFWLPLITIPIMSILLILLFLNNKSIKISLIIYLCIFLLIINIVLFVLYDFLIEYTKSKIDKELLEKENTFNLKQLNIIKSNYENLQIFRHDLKNHITYINKCVSNRNFEEILNYTHTILDEINTNNNFTLDTGNIVIDSILSFKFQEILKYNIKLDYNILVPYNLNINSVDLVSILGNLLDNIIEANIRIKNIENRYANIIIKYKNKKLLIISENNFNEINTYDNENFKTLKKEKDNHGIGIKSIKNTINKYNGFIEMKVKDNKFISKILLEL